MHERTYDLVKQNGSKHACIYENVTNEFAFSRGEKEQTCAFRMYWAMESFLMDCGGIFFKDLEERKSQTRSSASPSLDINHFGCLQKG